MNYYAKIVVILIWLKNIYMYKEITGAYQIWLMFYNCVKSIKTINLNNSYIAVKTVAYEWKRFWIN